jgi:hypothetical protein
MSIQNELSSEIAVALLARGGNDATRLKDLKEVVLKVHSILQEMTKRDEAKRARRAAAGLDNSRNAPRDPNDC